ncbi:S-layer protein [Paenibacillus beijingensis]|uniref:S-layer protein n=1 Tax=Paenibacillus beijingensis TaxID=1126833 RepID=A0A0D5NS87_9BACL|nr:S-layer protein [Paenibacillus beijingensis]
MLLCLTALLALLLPLQAAWAFTDTKQDPNADKIESLKKRGIVNGTGGGAFNPGGKVSYARGIAMIVKGLDLNLDNIRFIKEPKVTDYYPGLDNNAWYADAFIIAAVKGLGLPKDVDPDAAMTREQFADALFKAVSAKGEWVYPQIFILLKDEKQINPAYMESIQKLIVSKIVKLGKDSAFFPKKTITRSDAAGWLYNAIEFVEQMESQEPPSNPPAGPLTELKLSVEKAGDGINKITVTAQAPNPGYGLRIASIVFEGSKAIIAVEPVYPDPGKFYAQVITEVKAVTYADAAYTPVLASGSSSTGGSSGASGAVSSNAS